MNVHNRPRRVFILGVVAAGTALASARVHATKVDTKKYPKYAAGQNCASCALYQGKAGEAAGNCPLFAGKQVVAKGWCSAWAKKG